MGRVLPARVHQAERGRHVAAAQAPIDGPPEGRLRHWATLVKQMHPLCGQLFGIDALI